MLKARAVFLNQSTFSPVSVTDPWHSTRRSAHITGHSHHRKISKESLRGDFESLKAKGAVFLETRHPFTLSAQSRQAAEPRLSSVSTRLSSGNNLRYSRELISEQRNRLRRVRQLAQPTLHRKRRVEQERFLRKPLELHRAPESG